MHWVKLLVELWIALGLVTVVLGLFWMRKMSSEPRAESAKPAPRASTVLHWRV